MGMLIKKIREVIFSFFSRRDVIVEKVGTVIKMNKKIVLYFLSRNLPSPLHQKGRKNFVFTFFLENFIFTFILLPVLSEATTPRREFPSKAIRAAREII